MTPWPSAHLLDLPSQQLRLMFLWKPYMRAYEKCLSATSTSFAPWYVVPADDKENARVIVSQVLLDTLAALKMT